MMLSIPNKLKLISAIALISSTLLTVNGCQKTDDNKTVNEDNPVDTNASSEQLVNDSDTPTIVTIDSADSSETDAPNATINNNPIAIESPKAANDATNTSNISSASNNDVYQEKQITDVEYRNTSGNSIKITFQTSATEILQASVLLGNGQRVLLTAPSGQGNNPVYRSKDGSIELVTHGGGGSVDLINEGKSSSYDAVSADAEVISPAK